MNYWHVYHRAHLYRIGRPRWWGTQWVQIDKGINHSWPREFDSIDDAKSRCGEANSRLDLEVYYRGARWTRVEGP